VHQILFYIESHISIEAIIAYLHTYGYAFVFVGTFLEGEFVLLTAAFLAYLGVLNFWLVLIIGFLGAVLGDNMWYWIGSKRGTAFLNKYGKFLLLTPVRMKKLKILFLKHSTKTVFLSRFLIGMRISSALFAGAMGMPKAQFRKANIIGGAVWAIVTTVIGYVFGSSFSVLREYLHRSQTVLLILLAVIIIIYVLQIILERLELN
jgi:membrane protein DedA with SNARE-associated domain